MCSKTPLICVSQAAGITSVIKAALMFEKNVIPPHAGLKGRLNHKFPDLDAMNIHIAMSKKEFKPHSGGDGKRKILINNFNATVSDTPWKMSSQAN